MLQLRYLGIYCFYSIAFIVLFIIFYRNIRYKKQAKPFLCGGLSLLTVIVASEFWELPIFILGAFGIVYWWPWPSFAFVLHHIFVAVMFVLLVWLAKITDHRFALLNWAVGLLANSILLLAFPLNLDIGWVARFLGTMWFAGGVYDGSSLVGAKP